MSGRGHNITYLSTSDQGGRPDGAQVMVHDGYAYVGHLFSGGVTVIDVRDPRDPKPLQFIPAQEDTWTLHLQTHEDLLMVVNEANLFFPETLERRRYEGGLRIYDISDRPNPKEIGFMPVDGPGVHRMWYDGGDYAYLSCLLDGYNGHMLVIADVSDPARPHEVGRFWLDGMWEAGGEEKTWGDRRYWLHHALVADGIAYAAWRDAGLVLIDVSDPTSPSLIARRSWSPPYAGNTHNPLPLPGKGAVVALDEASGDSWPDPEKHIWMVDARAPENPVTVAKFPTPSDIDYPARNSRFGPHNLWENRKGAFQSEDLVFAAYCNAGVRVFDTTDIYSPKEVAYFVPADPTSMVDPRPNRPQTTQSCDVFVDANGVMYVTDYNGGLTILQYEG